MDPWIIEKARRETPGCKHVVHLNNAGASLMPSIVLCAIKGYLDVESKLGGYEAAELKAGELAEFYDLCGRMINARPHQVAFTANATDAYSRALSSIPFNRGDVLLTTRHDYVSNQIAFINYRKRFGIRIEFIPSDDKGLPDIDGAARMMDTLHPKLVSVTHIPTNCGTVQPVEAIGRLCRSRGILYLVDACQSVGQRHIDVQAMGCDFLSATTRKFLRGPRGAGLLYVSQNVLDQNLEPLWLDMRGAEWVADQEYRLFEGARRFEDWEFPYALMQGTSAAIRYALNIGIENIQSRTTRLAEILRQRCRNLKGITVLDRGEELSGIVTLAAKDWAPGELKEEMKKEKINVSTVERSSALYDFDAKGAEGVLRISPHYYNTEDELSHMIEVLTKLL